MLDASDFVLLPTCNALMFTLRNQVRMYAGEFAYLQSRGAKKKDIWGNEVWLQEKI